MCRIACIIQTGTEKVTPFEIKTFLLEMEYGGKDATGIAFISEDDFVYAKQKGGAKDVLPQDFETKIEELTASSKAIMLHTRASTHGSPNNNNNNHPLVGNKYMLVHNGIVHTDRKYPAIGETDSEQMLRSMEMHGIVDGLNRCSGWVATIFASITNRKDLYWFTNPVGTLSAGYDAERKIWFLASTYALIKASSLVETKEYSILSNTLYKYDLKTNALIISGKPVVNGHYYSSSYSWTNWVNDKNRIWNKNKVTT